MRTLGPIRLSESDYTRLLKLKSDEGFGKRDWGDWFRFKAVNVQLEENLDELIDGNTANMMNMWMNNFAQNLVYLQVAHNKGQLEQLRNLPLRNLHDARDLLPKQWFDVPMDEVIPEGPAIVIGRGPSIFSHKHLDVLGNWKFRTPPVLVVTDGMLIECLRAGITPDRFPIYVCSIDGNRRLIVRWYGDPDFDENNPQATDAEKETNKENLSLVERWASKLKIILGSTVANNVLRRCLAAGAHVYLLHPLFDSVGMESLTRVMHYMTQTDETPPLITSANWWERRCYGLDYGVGAAPS